MVKNDTAVIPAIDGRVEEIHKYITRDQDSKYWAKRFADQESY